MRFILPLFLILGACSSTQKNPAPVPNKIVDGRSSNIPRPYHVKVLPNGLTIYFVRDEDLPRVSLQAIVRVGSVNDPEGRDGLNSLVCDVLDQGTTSRNAEQLADAFNGIGTEFSASAGSDGTVIGASALTPQAGELLDLFADVILNPAFNKKEISRAKDQVRSVLKRRKDNPGSVVSRKFDDYIFGDSPYGRDEIGTEASMMKIERVDLMRHYLEYYRPNRTLLAVTGRYGPEFEQKVIDTFTKWAARDVKDAEIKPLAPIDHLSLRFVTKPDLVQAQIRFGMIGVERANPDYLKLRLASEALGGGFASRLMSKIRNEMGLTYSISSGIDARKYVGLLTISTFTRNDSVGKTVDETLKVYRDFTDKGVNEGELAMAKAQLVGQYPRSYETSDGMAMQLLSTDFYGLPIDYLEKFPENVGKITVAQVNDVIKKHLHPDQVKVLIYGNAKAIGNQLKSWSPEVQPLK